MKKLILMRHAKSCWNQPWQDDHQRPLSDRGLRDAPNMAQKLQGREIRPDKILSSSSTRTLQTADILVSKLNLGPDLVEVESDLYHASPPIILKHLQLLSDSVCTVILVGHNPGLNELIKLFGIQLDNLPTAGQIGFLINSNQWNQLKPEHSNFWFLDFPKKIT